MEKRIRIEDASHIIRNSWDEEVVDDKREAKFVSIEDDDCLGVHSTLAERILYCGCKDKSGGACSQCSGVICRECLRLYRCLCGAPLCPFHAQRSFDVNDNIIYLCPACRRRRAYRSLLTPFVRFKE